VRTPTATPIEQLSACLLPERGDEPTPPLRLPLNPLRLPGVAYDIKRMLALGGVTVRLGTAWLTP